MRFVVAVREQSGGCVGFLQFLLFVASRPAGAGSSSARGLGMERRGWQQQEGQQKKQQPDRGTWSVAADGANVPSCGEDRAWSSDPFPRASCPMEGAPAAVVTRQHPSQAGLGWVKCSRLLAQ